MVLVAEAVSIIFNAYKYFKETYEKLSANEVTLQQLLDEIFLYEALIRIYAEKIQSTAGPSQDRLPFAEPIKLFSNGISGVHGLLLDYTSKKQSRLQRAWNFCKNWCSTAENAAKIKDYTENVARAIQLLEFAGEVLILNKVDAMVEEQAEVQRKMSFLLGNLDQNAARL